MIALVLALTVSSEVKAQISDPLKGSVGTTTTAGNGHWVSAQVAIKQGSLDAAFLGADRACQEGTAIACAFAGELIIQGKAPLATPEQSAGLFKRGCELGNANACQGIGLMLVQGIGISEDVQAGKAFMDRACSAQNAMACTNLGLMYKMGLFGPPNRAQSEAYLSQALHMQPDNEVAQRALAEVGAMQNQAGEENLPGSLQQLATLRGRAEPETGATDSPNSQSIVAKPIANLCQRHVITALMDVGSQDPRKPSWNFAPGSRLDAARITRQIELLLAFTDAGAALAADNVEPSVPSDLPELDDCEAAYSDQIKAFDETPWLLAAVEPRQPIIYAVTRASDAASPSEANIRKITLITDSRRTSGSKKDLSSGVWNGKTLSSFQVSCQANEILPLFALQFDQQSKLVAGSGLPLVPPDPPGEAIQTRGEIARTLACAPPQQITTPATILPLEAAMSLRFEQDQQQAP